MTDFMAWLRGHLAQGAVAPRYIQLAMAIETAIRQQVLAAEAFLPPERQMAEGLALSRVTVSKAMKLLEEKGLILRQQGVGTRVAMHIGYSSIRTAVSPLRRCVTAAASAIDGCCAPGRRTGQGRGGTGADGRG